MYLELTEVNSNLAGIIAPLLLGAAATGYLASSGAGAVGGLLGLVSRAKDFAAANTGAVAAGAVATGVAVAAVATVVVTQLGGPEKQDVTADPGAGITSSAPAVPGQRRPVVATVGPVAPVGVPERLGPHLDGQRAARRRPRARAPARPLAPRPPSRRASRCCPPTCRPTAPPAGSRRADRPTDRPTDAARRTASPTPRPTPPRTRRPPSRPRRASPRSAR